MKKILSAKITRIFYCLNYGPSGTKTLTEGVGAQNRVLTDLVFFVSGGSFNFYGRGFK
jgi:hypothetical protein